MKGCKFKHLQLSAMKIVLHADTCPETGPLFFKSNQKNVQLNILNTDILEKEQLISILTT
jgi:hypothetical protein